MTYRNYDDYYMDIALTVQRRAKCLKRTVGAVLVKNDRVIATGFNGTPSGIPNCTQGGCHRCLYPEEYPEGSGYDHCLCVHAEQNTLLMAARDGVSVAGATCYTTLQPCFSCLKEMYQAGIVKVYSLEQWDIPAEIESLYWDLADRFSDGFWFVRQMDTQPAYVERVLQEHEHMAALYGAELDRAGDIGLDTDDPDRYALLSNQYHREAGRIEGIRKLAGELNLLRRGVIFVEEEKE